MIGIVITNFPIIYTNFKKTHKRMTIQGFHIVGRKEKVHIGLNKFILLNSYYEVFLKEVQVIYNINSIFANTKAAPSTKYLIPE